MSEPATTQSTDPNFFLEVIKRAILPLTKLFRYRFWVIPNEIPQEKLKKSNDLRIQQERRILEEWIGGMDADVRRMVLCKLEDAESNQKVLNIAISAKITCARKLLEHKLPIAASILMKQVTGWHEAKNKGLPFQVLEIAMITAKVQAQESTLPEGEG
jgi:hypothetical protein